MDRETDFLDALTATDDDLAWLAYADWLEERGDARGEYVRLLVALGRGEVPPEGMTTAVGRLGQLWGKVDRGWADRCARLRAGRPMRFRVLEVLVEERPGVFAGSRRTRTLLHGVLEAGTVRVGDPVALPLETGEALPERVRRLDGGGRPYPQLSAGEVPRVFSLAWPGRRPPVLRGGVVVPSEAARGVLEPLLQMALYELELSVRATNCLESEGITTVRDLVVRTDEELLEVRNFGETTLAEVQGKLEAIGLDLGMTCVQFGALRAPYDPPLTSP